VHALVLLQSPEICEHGRRRALGRVGRVSDGVDAGIDDLNGRARNPAANEVVGRTLADRLERHVSIDAPERTLGGPHGGGERRRELLKRGSAEEVWDERDRSLCAPARRIQRDLVDVLDDDVGPARELLVVKAARAKRKGMARPDAIDVNAVERCTRRTARPAAAQQPYFMAHLCETSKNLVQMDLSSARLRIL